MEQTARAIPQPSVTTPAPSVEEESTLPLGLQWKEGNEELAATVIMKAGSEPGQEEVITRPTAPPLPPEEALPETIILPRSRTEGKPSPQLGPRSTESEPVHPEPGSVGRQAASPPAASREKLVSQPSRSGATDAARTEQEVSPLSDEDTFTGLPDEKKTDTPEEDDLLMETIILSPRKGPNGPDKKK
ncbi:MAG: hypothetical protein AB9873_03200 [Syntrophobacteraceae bacterium]